VLWGTLLLPLVFFRSRLVAAAALLAAGAAYAPYTVVQRSLTQRLSPERTRAAVLGAIGTISVVGTPLGALIGDILLDHASAPTVIALSSALCILIGAGALRARPLTPIATPASAPASDARTRHGSPSCKHD
jgi:predicted MFS family arabinose efflux permease